MMGSELVFKAWDYNAKKMIGPFTMWDIVLGDKANELHEECFFLMFTGLRDKNDAMIFEGDILHQNNYSDWVVVWHECGFHICNVCNPETFFTLVKSDREIIGNIYESADLLK